MCSSELPHCGDDACSRPPLSRGCSSVWAIEIVASMAAHAAVSVISLSFILVSCLVSATSALL